MSFKIVIKTLIVSAFLMACSVVAFGQATVEGTVLIKGEGTSFVPVEGAKLICFRLDVEEKCGTLTTGADGKFKFENLPKEAKVGIGYSGPKIAPGYYSEFSVTEKRAKNLYVLVSAGDGSEAPETQLRASIIGQDLSAEEKADRTKGEIENQKRFESLFDVTKKNEMRQQYLKDGQEAFKAGDFDTAVAKFHAGYEVDREFLGSAPGFLNNKAVSLTKRAVKTYNANSKNYEVINNSVLPDLLLSLKSSYEAYNLVEGSNSLEGTSAKAKSNNMELSKVAIREVFNVLSQMKLPLPANSEEEAKTSIDVYKAGLKILEDDFDIMSGLMLTLYNAGAFSGDETKFQESLNYGAYYLKKAPKSHSQYAAVREIVDLIKTDNKLTPKPLK